MRGLAFFFGIGLAGYATTLGDGMDWFVGAIAIAILWWAVADKR